MLKIGRIVKIGDVDASPSWRMASLGCWNKSVIMIVIVIITFIVIITVIAIVIIIIVIIWL